jgi:hypothetical protein
LLIGFFVPSTADCSAANRLYSITALASASNFSGIARPIDFAVLMITTRPVSLPIKLELVADRLPTIGGERQFVATGGLMTYGPDGYDVFRQAGANSLHDLVS